MLYYEFSLRKFYNLNFHFMKQYFPNSNIIIITYSCIYLLWVSSSTKMELILGPLTYLLVGFTLNLSNGAPTQAWLLPTRSPILQYSTPHFVSSFSCLTPFFPLKFLLPFYDGLVLLLYAWVSGVAIILFPLTHVFPRLLESQGILT